MKRGKKNNDKGREGAAKRQKTVGKDIKKGKENKAKDCADKGSCCSKLIFFIFIFLRG